MPQRATTHRAPVPEISPVARERRFDPWRIPRTANAEALVDTVINDLIQYEQQNGIRSRKRRAGDLGGFEGCVTAVVCDVVVAALEGWRGIHLSRSHRHLYNIDRYSAPTDTKILRNVLDLMASNQLQYLRQLVSGGGNTPRGKRQTVVLAGQALQRKIAEHGVTLGDFIQNERQETIILKSKADDFWDKPTIQDYEDTDHTEQLRSELMQINRHLASADILYQPPELPQTPIDHQTRHLRRIFGQGNWQSGGRLFGGFWQTLSKKNRFTGILIDGEAVCEVDYGQILPRLVYAWCGVVPVMEDLYQIPGIDGCRPGIKKIFATMLFRERPLKRFPKDTKNLFPPGVKVDQVVDAIQAAHAPIAKKFFKGLGHFGQFQESSILVSVLLQLNQQGITALPVHDAVIIPLSARSATTNTMLAAFRQTTGAEGRVDVTWGCTG